MSNKVKLIVISLLIIAIGSIFLNDKEPKENTTYVSDNSKSEAENIILDSSSNFSNIESSDLFSDFYEQAESILKDMTLEEKVGQMFLARFPENGVIEEIKKYNPCGYILFGRDFEAETKSSILKKLNQCQEASKIKLIFGVDEEGGQVARVSAYTQFRSSRFSSPQTLWEKGKLTAILNDSSEKSNLLKSIGINMNLAPVADVATKESSFIYDRSFGKDAKQTAEYISSLIKTMNDDGMISVMKHFPGYGDNADTHTGIAIDERPYSEFEKSDFLPFISGIKQGAPCILVSHNIVNAIDSKKPASLSEEVHSVLRNKLKFSGIIMTDDLAMDAIKEYDKNEDSAVQAVIAGNDIIISSNFKKQRQDVINAVKQGKISEEIINKAVRRILALKYMYKII